MILILLFATTLLFLKFRYKKYSTTVSRLLLISSTLFFVIFLISYPKEAVQSAKNGVDIWFNIVLPSLLPFFIGAELLIRLGVVSFIGSILEPLIRPVFNVPGEGSFVFAMSLTSGYPVGVKIVSKLRKEGIFSKEEGQRVMSFSSTSGPLFMLGAVAIGMFHSIALGTMIALSHYLGAIATGIVFRFYKRNIKATIHPMGKNHSITHAFKQLMNSKVHPKQPFGRILGESVKESIETILIVGGFIILFSVIINILSISKIILFFSSLLLPLWKWLGFNQEIQHGIISGIFEITVGCKLISQVQSISFLQQAIIATMIISWSGLSIIAQAASMIHDTDLSVSVYVCSKLLHSIFSGFFAFLLVPLYQFTASNLNMPVFHPTLSPGLTETWSDKVFFSCQLFTIIVLTLIAISIIFASVFNKFSSTFLTKK
ncbi:sporulation integral membrane protein YlbJ [Anaerosolibacter carboniphilus]|uniref:Sporulation integral membrane protein YlbJ n=1 Tax=Anaerosolibacter carboniphilus TaxID=1417629 RepID=A0A841KWS9_9FIRM|nr:sporulation integral membrane protein YlbJ [Anaerosolibacter carboniphilus]MBB6217823.1 sporulation integral membrane protein YlbJ [Anaerosolibacter carboniphilus]